MAKAPPATETVYLRDAHKGKGDACWMPCNKVDAGAVPFIPLSEQLTDADYEQAKRSMQQNVRALDVMINGEAGAAKQALLIDLFGQIGALIALRQYVKHAVTCPRTKFMATCTCGLDQTLRIGGAPR